MSETTVGRWHRVQPWVSLLCRLVLAGVLGVAGAIKLPDPDESVRAVRAYDLLPESVAVLVGHTLPLLEVALALLLLLGLATRLVAAVSALVMVAFVIGIASAWTRGLSIDCGCFGGGGQVAAGETEYLPDLIRDAVLVALALFLAWRPDSRWSLDGLLHTRTSREDT